MMENIKRELLDLAREVLSCTRKDQSFTAQAALLCASSKKACGRGFFSRARRSKPCRDTSPLRRSRKKLRRCGRVADARVQKPGAKGEKPCRKGGKPCPSSKGTRACSSSACSRASEAGAQEATGRCGTKVLRR